jgi:hypothetical protein
VEPDDLHVVRLGEQDLPRDPGGFEVGVQYGLHLALLHVAYTPFARDLRGPDGEIPELGLMEITRDGVRRTTKE